MAIPIVEIGIVPEFFFTDIEVEIVAGQGARFMLLCEQRPMDCESAPAENVLKVRCTTLVALVPRMIRKTIFALGQNWGRNGMSGLTLPM